MTVIGPNKEDPLAEKIRQEMIDDIDNRMTRIECEKKIDNLNEIIKKFDREAIKAYAYTKFSSGLMQKAYQAYLTITGKDAQDIEEMIVGEFETTLTDVISSGYRIMVELELAHNEGEKKFSELKDLQEIMYGLEEAKADRDEFETIYQNAFDIGKSLENKTRMKNLLRGQLARQYNRFNDFLSLIDINGYNLSDEAEEKIESFRSEETRLRLESIGFLKEGEQIPTKSNYDSTKRPKWVPTAGQIIDGKFVPCGIGKWVYE